MTPKQGMNTTRVELVYPSSCLCSQSYHLLAESDSIWHCVQCASRICRYLHVSLIIGGGVLLVTRFADRRRALQALQLRSGYISWPRSRRRFRVRRPALDDPLEKDIL